MMTQAQPRFLENLEFSKAKMNLKKKLYDSLLYHSISLYKVSQSVMIDSRVGPRS